MGVKPSAPLNITGALLGLGLVLCLASVATAQGNFEFYEPQLLCNVPDRRLAILRSDLDPMPGELLGQFPYDHVIDDYIPFEEAVNAYMAYSLPRISQTWDPAATDAELRRGFAFFYKNETDQLMIARINLKTFTIEAFCPVSVNVTGSVQLLHAYDSTSDRVFLVTADSIVAFDAASLQVADSAPLLPVANAIPVWIEASNCVVYVTYLFDSLSGPTYEVFRYNAQTLELLEANGYASGEEHAIGGGFLAVLNGSYLLNGVAKKAVQPNLVVQQVVETPSILIYKLSNMNVTTVIPIPVDASFFHYDNPGFAFSRDGYYFYILTETGMHVYGRPCINNTFYADYFELINIFDFPCSNGTQFFGFCLQKNEIWTFSIGIDDNQTIIIIIDSLEQQGSLKALGKHVAPRRVQPMDVTVQGYVRTFISHFHLTDPSLDPTFVSRFDLHWDSPYIRLDSDVCEDPDLTDPSASGVFSNGAGTFLASMLAGALILFMM